MTRPSKEEINEMRRHGRFSQEPLCGHFLLRVIDALEEAYREIDALLLPCGGCADLSRIRKQKDAEIENLEKDCESRACENYSLNLKINEEKREVTRQSKLIQQERSEFSGKLKQKDAEIETLNLILQTTHEAHEKALSAIEQKDTEIECLTTSNQKLQEATLLSVKEVERLKILDELLPAFQQSVCKLTEKVLDLEVQLAEQAALIEKLERENKAFLTMTESLEDHPEDWDGPCYCQTCQSYGDQHVE